MRNRLVLLAGWGLGTAPLQPLADALRGLDERLHVEIEPLPELPGSDPQAVWSIATGCKRSMYYIYDT